VSNISVQFRLYLDLRCIVDRIRVVLESDSCSIWLIYNVRGVTQCNSQGELEGCVGAQGSKVL
jgi:hypothetical protein